MAHFCPTVNIFSGIASTWSINEPSNGYVDMYDCYNNSGEMMINAILLCLQVIGWMGIFFVGAVGTIVFMVLIGATSYKIAQFIFQIMNINYSWEPWIISWKKNKNN